MPAGLSARRLPPGGDVFQRLGQIEIFERVVEPDREAFASQAAEVVGLEPRGVGQNFGVERRVVPPIGGHAADRTHTFVSA